MAKLVPSHRCASPRTSVCVGVRTYTGSLHGLPRESTIVKRSTEFHALNRLAPPFWLPLYFTVRVVVTVDSALAVMVVPKDWLALELKVCVALSSPPTSTPNPLALNDTVSEVLELWSVVDEIVVSFVRASPVVLE